MYAIFSLQSCVEILYSVHCIPFTLLSSYTLLEFHRSKFFLLSLYPSRICFLIHNAFVVLCHSLSLSVLHIIALYVPPFIVSCLLTIYFCISLSVALFNLLHLSCYVPIFVLIVLRSLSCFNIHSSLHVRRIPVVFFVFIIIFSSCCVHCVYHTLHYSLSFCPIKLSIN